MLKKDFKEAPEKKKKPQVYITSDEVVHERRLLLLKRFGVGLFGFFLGIVLFVLVTSGGGILRDWIEMFIRNRFVTQLEMLRKTPETPAPQVLQTTPPPVTISEEIPSFFEKITKPFFEVLKNQEKPQTLPQNLISSSFTDLFSGVGWLDVSRTNMYHDKVITAFTLEPNFTWRKLDGAHIQQERFLKKNDNGIDRRCIGSSCLEQRGLGLFYNGGEISLPREMRSKNVQNVSIGTLGEKWLVGVTAKEKEKYEGWVFFYSPSTDGSAYSRVFGEANAPFLSDYEGTIGFGGTKDNWIALYGAYEGQAYHIREGKPFQNISKFFGIRAMAGGFHPAILRAGDGVDARWYVYSLTKGRPVFIKLFQDGNVGDIRGSMDFTQSVLGTNFFKVSFAVADVRGGTTALEADALTNDGNEELWQFVDEGFKVPSLARVVSINLNNYPAEVWTATIVDSDVFEGKSNIEFALSNDGVSWIPARIGEPVVFPDPNNNRLFWRATFQPEDGARFSSPFFDRIRVDYKVKFL